MIVKLFFTVPLKRNCKKKSGQRMQKSIVPNDCENGEKKSGQRMYNMAPSAPQAP